MLDIHSISQPYTCLVLFSALRQDSTLVDSYLAFGGFQAERFSSHTTAAVRVREWPGTHTLLPPPSLSSHMHSSSFLPLFPLVECRQEYVRHMAPRSSNLILWRNAGNTGGPFRRTFARAEMWYRPLDANTATPTGHKCSDAPWIWGNLVCWCCVCVWGG